MNSTAAKGPRTSGRAVVLLRHTDNLHAHVEIVGKLAHLTCVERRRCSWRQPAADRAVPLAQIVEIRWLEAAASEF
jgi:hypothetical protein